MSYHIDGKIPLSELILNIHFATGAEISEQNFIRKFWISNSTHLDQQC
jgi:hypothetical protein